MQNNYNKVENYEVASAGFFVRLVAFLIDTLFVFLVVQLIKIPTGIMAWIWPGSFLNIAILFQYTIVDVFVYLCGVLYFIIFTYCAGATLGKKVMNIMVVSSTEEELTKLQVVYRETIGRFLTSVILNLGYLLIFADKEKRALHDRLSDTKVVYAKRIKTNTYYKSEQTGYVPAYVEPEMYGETKQEEEDAFDQIPMDDQGHCGEEESKPEI